MPYALDIIIPTFGRPSNIESLVSALYHQIRENDTITVVWQGYTRPALSPRERLLIVHSSPPNLPLARNKGIKEGNNDIVFFIDDDVVPEEGLLEAHRKMYADPEIGAVAGRLKDPAFDGSQGVPSLIDFQTGDCRQDFAVPASQESISMMGANMSVRRSVFEKTGMFDTNFRHNAWWEDIDMSLRIRNAGYKIRYCADARAVHMRESDGGCRQDRGNAYLFHQFANTAYFACKHVPLKYWPGWIRFWKYRLEYLSRTGRPVNGRRSHSPWKVLSGIFGACAGWLRNFRNLLPVSVSTDNHR